MGKLGGRRSGCRGMSCPHVLTTAARETLVWAAFRARLSVAATFSHSPPHSHCLFVDSAAPPGSAEGQGTYGQAPRAYDTVRLLQESLFVG